MTALLESTELIVRGAIRKRTPRANIEGVEVRGDSLRFVVRGEAVEFDLGADLARRWAVAIGVAPRTLASKLGVSRSTRVRFMGTPDDDALRAALEEAPTLSAPFEEADLAFVRADDDATLQRWFVATEGEDSLPPVWIVYVKGKNAPLGEQRVREAMRAHGFVDTKVAAVSERLTALRFVRPGTRPKR